MLRYKMSVVSGLCLLCLGTVCLGSLGNPRTIRSIGDYENPLFQWAVGISNLEFFYSNTASSDMASYRWYYDGKQVAYMDCYGCYPTNGTVGIKVNCLNSTSTCNFLNSTLHILRKLVLGNVPISVRNTDDKKIANETLTILYCKNLTSEQPQGLKIVDGTNAEFGTTATYQCNTNATHNLTVNKRYTDSYDYQSLCRYNASWSKMDEVECHYIPRIRSQATQNSFVDGDIVIFTCDAEDGYPNKTTFTNFIEDKIIAETQTLTHHDHGKLFHCEASNTYADHINSPSKSPQPYNRLVVYFAPILEGHSEHTTYINQSGKVYFSFRANNKSGEIETSFQKRNAGNKIDGSCNNISVNFYNCSYTIEITNSSEDYGEYVFTASTEEPPGNINVTIDITNSPPVRPTETGLDIALIAGVCGGAAALVVILVVLLLVRRWRNKDASGESAKEERENPLYGTAPAHPGKEEKSNPLYTSSGIQEGGIEEAYGVVDGKTKKKNAAKDGNSNSAFTSDGAEVTYAAVNKPKKKSSAAPQEAVYTAVNKKKVEKGSNEENGLHGKPSIDG